MPDNPDPVDKLSRFISRSKIDVSVLAAQSSFLAFGVRHIKIESASSNVIVPVNDEWREADCAAPEYLLHMVLQACEYFEESQDYQEWRIDHEFPDKPLIRELYENMQDIANAARKILGHEIEAIPDFDMQLHTGVAKKLRSKMRP